MTRRGILVQDPLINRLIENRVNGGQYLFYVLAPSPFGGTRLLERAFQNAPISAIDFPLCTAAPGSFFRRLDICHNRSLSLEKRAHYTGEMPEVQLQKAERQTTGSRRQTAGGRKQTAGGRKQTAGGRRQAGTASFVIGQW